MHDATKGSQGKFPKQDSSTTTSAEAEHERSQQRGAIFESFGLRTQWICAMERMYGALSLCDTIDFCLQTR